MLTRYLLHDTSSTPPPAPSGGINVLYEGTGANDNYTQPLTHTFPTPPPVGSQILLIQGNDANMTIPPDFTMVYDGVNNLGTSPTTGIDGLTVRVMVSKLAGDGTTDVINIPYSGRPQPYIVYVLDSDIELDAADMWIQPDAGDTSGFYSVTSTVPNTKALFVGGMRNTNTAQTISTDGTYQNQIENVSTAPQAKNCVAIAAGLKDIPNAGTSVLPANVVWDFLDSTAGLNLLLRAI